MSKVCCLFVCFLLIIERKSLNRCRKNSNQKRRKKNVKRVDGLREETKVRMRIGMGEIKLIELSEVIVVIGKGVRGLIENEEKRIRKGVEVIKTSLEAVGVMRRQEDLKERRNEVVETIEIRATEVVEETELIEINKRSTFRNPKLSFIRCPIESREFLCCGCYVVFTG